MKTLFALLFVFASTAVFASVDPCQSSTQQTVPAPHSRATPRIKHKTPVAPMVGPKLHLTPLKMERPFEKPMPKKISTVLKFNCAAPLSLPPGSVDIGGGVPLIGERPQWGNPTPLYLATGPMPVWPGSPDDFPPAAYAPPGAVPPNTTEVPEPPTIALMLFGVLFLTRKVRHETMEIFEHSFNRYQEHLFHQVQSTLTPKGDSEGV